jgi:hypothetical protein
MAAIPVFDIGNVLVEWTPHGVFRSFFATAQEVDAFLIEIGFWAWNIEQDRGRSMPEGIAPAARSMRSPISIRICFATPRSASLS